MEDGGWEDGILTKWMQMDVQKAEFELSNYGSAG
jgi:hypothetical protein